MHNHPRLPTIIHNHLRLSTTTYSLPQPPTVFHNHLQSSTTTYSLPQPPTVFHNHLQSSTTTYSLPQPPTVFHNHPRVPRSTHYFLQSPTTNTTCPNHARPSLPAPITSTNPQQPLKITPNHPQSSLIYHNLPQPPPCAYLILLRHVPGEDVGVESVLEQGGHLRHPLRHLHDLTLASLRLSHRLLQLATPLLHLQHQGAPRSHTKHQTPVIGWVHSKYARWQQGHCSDH